MLELTIGIVGATGVVGQTAFDILADDFSGFKVKKLKMYASRSSAGKVFNFRNSKVTIEEINLESLQECDAILFATDAAISQEYIPKLAEKGILCIDKSSAFRSHSAVPLVVPEVNADQLAYEKIAKFPVIASPNCCTIPLVMVLKALDEKFSLIRAIVSTYQSVSGAGKPAVEVLTEETKNFFVNQDLTCGKSDIFPKSIAFNVMPYVAGLLENGDTDEESKIISETRKILANPKLLLAATSVRVPTFVGHGESVTLEFKNKVTAAQVKETLSQFSGISVIDEKSKFEEDDYELFVTPREAHGKDDVFVSRVRKTEVFENGIALWIVSDNLRKGAALNAIQIINFCALNGTILSLKRK
ncbi:aspartate-semialdehyde dehydrogenase [Fluviispira multicolorata]|uniref:Aspartate-semialdehyde dehydrogenase n=1 Tax=Fluviispira multicolorata TaxID=2654512 RepID=A0A833JEF2_9BACT|nr:aspartate-semialdehyde dehydrogenase [Fluviispira multicolorata]KAB8033181.1 aspartate-semialdehyde dehydrogenase [Fluviispira multicolorata]